MRPSSRCAPTLTAAYDDPEVKKALPFADRAQAGDRAGQVAPGLAGLPADLRRRSTRTSTRRSSGRGLAGGGAEDRRSPRWSRRWPPSRSMASRNRTSAAGTARSGAPGESRSAAWRGSWCRRHCCSSRWWRCTRSSTRSGSRCTSTRCCRRACRAGPSRTPVRQLHRRALGHRQLGVLGRRRSTTFVFTVASPSSSRRPRPRDGAWPCTRRSRARACCARSCSSRGRCSRSSRRSCGRRSSSPNLGFVNTCSVRRAADDTVWLGRGAAGADGDDLRRRVEDGAVHGAARCSPACR